MDRPTCSQCVEHKKHISSLEDLNAELMDGIERLVHELRAAGITTGNPQENRTKYAATRPSHPIRTGIATYKRVSRAGWQTR